MAELESPEQTSQESAPTAPPKAEPKKGRGPLLIVALVALLLLVGIAVAVYLFFLKPEEQGLRITNPEEAQFIETYNLRKQESINQLKGARNPIFSDLFSYTVNMRDGKHMMHLSFRVKLYDPLARDYVAGIKPAIDDMMYGMLKSLRPEDLRNRAGLELLKRDIYQAINGLFPQEFIEQSPTRDRTPVKQVLIEEYYIQ